MKDFGMMIERNYNILNTFEQKMNNFFKEYENLDKKIVFKETAFSNAKNRFEEYIRMLDDTIREHKENIKEIKSSIRNFINDNTEDAKEILNSKLEEIFEEKEQKAVQRIENIVTVLESFQANINSKIRDILKTLPVDLENATQNYINNIILELKSIGNTLKSNVEEHKLILTQELKKYKEDTIQEIENSNRELKKNTTEIKIIAQSIKKDNDNINKLNNNLDRINKGTVKLNYILSGINNSSILKKIYILLFSVINVFFILRIIIPTTYKINFKSQLIMNIIIIAGAILIILSIVDLAYSIFLYFFREEIKEDEN